MGCIGSKAADFAVQEHEQEEALLGPPSKVMDASEEAQRLVMLVNKTLELHLVKIQYTLDNLKATQMITRSAGPNDNNGTMYYIKVKTSLSDWPWIFVKIWFPPIVTGVSPVKFRGLKKMTDDYELVTF